MPPMDKVHLYLFDQYDALPDGFVAEHLLLLPSARQEQCLRYRQAIDQQNCVIAYLLLQQGLREEYGITDQAIFTYGAHGKPCLKSHPNIFFNISHCKHGVACALADFEIGVDIQDVRPYDPSIARRVCSEAELRLLSEANDPARLFCKLWATRESYAKMLGCSMADTLGKKLPLHSIEIISNKNFYIAFTSLHYRQYHLCCNNLSWPEISPL